MSLIISVLWGLFFVWLRKLREKRLEKGGKGEKKVGDQEENGELVNP